MGEKKLPNGLYAWSDADRKARREKEEREKKLAQLGVRALEILKDLGPGYMRYSAIEDAARELSLLTIDTPEEERRTPLDEERASFHRETLERRHDD